MGMWEALVKVIEVLSMGGGLTLVLAVLLIVAVLIWLAAIKYGIPHLQLVAVTLEGIKTELAHISENQKETNTKLSELYKQFTDLNVRVAVIEQARKK